VFGDRAREQENGCIIGESAAGYVPGRLCFRFPFLGPAAVMTHSTHLLKHRRKPNIRGEAKDFCVGSRASAAEGLAKAV